MSATPTNHELAKCLSSVTVTYDTTTTKYTLSTAATDNAFVPSMWSGDANSYQQFMLCPSESSAAASSLLLALNGYIYGFSSADTPKKASGVKTDGVTFPTRGVVQVDVGAAEGTDKLIYVIRATTGDTTAIDAENAVVFDGTADGTNAIDAAYAAYWKDNDNIGQACGAGRYGLLLDLAVDIKLCPLCPAGSTGDGNGCTACAAGKASSVVGQTTANGCGTTCGAGFYAQEGERQCWVGVERAGMLFVLCRIAWLAWWLIRG